MSMEIREGLQTLWALTLDVVTLPVRRPRELYQQSCYGSQLDDRSALDETPPSSGNKIDALIATVGHETLNLIVGGAIGVELVVLGCLAAHAAGVELPANPLSAVVTGFCASQIFGAKMDYVTGNPLDRPTELGYTKPEPMLPRYEHLKQARGMQAVAG